MQGRRIIGSGLTAAGLFLCIMIGGCEKPLFAENLPRTQYERYDRLRGRYVPAEQVNAYGGREPALRDRLTPPQD